MLSSSHIYMCRHGLMHAWVRKSKTVIHPHIHIGCTCVFLPIILEIWVLHRHFIASSSAIHSRQVQHECKEHAPNKTQKCLWSTRMPLGPFIGKTLPPRPWWLATTARTSLCLWCRRGPGVLRGMCMSLGRARCWCCFLMFSLPIKDVVFKCIQILILWWIISKFNITHIFAFRGPSPIARGDVLRSPNS